MARSAKIAPLVFSMLRRIFCGSTESPPATSAIEAIATAVDWTTAATTGHSACQPPTPRSCSCSIAERNDATSPGTRCAAASVSEQAVGLPLFDIVDDAPGQPAPDL